MPALKKGGLAPHTHDAGDLSDYPISALGNRYKAHLQCILQEFHFFLVTAAEMHQQDRCTATQGIIGAVNYCNQNPNTALTTIATGTPPWLRVLPTPGEWI